jgi:hypothetical protein
MARVKVALEPTERCAYWLLLTPVAATDGKDFYRPGIHTIWSWASRHFSGEGGGTEGQLGLPGIPTGSPPRMC